MLNYGAARTYAYLSGSDSDRSGVASDTLERFLVLKAWTTPWRHLDKTRKFLVLSALDHLRSFEPSRFAHILFVPQIARSLR